MARMLILTYSKQSLDAYEAAGVPTMRTSSSLEMRSQMVAHFEADPNGLLVASATLAHTGWRVRAEAFVVFDPSWPYAADHPITIQALGRVRHISSPSPTASEQVSCSRGVFCVCDDPSPRCVEFAAMRLGATIKR